MTYIASPAEIAILTLSTLAVWLPGTLFAAILLARYSLPRTLIAAHGLLLGYFIMNLLLRAMDALNVPLRFASVCVLLGLISLVLWLVFRLVVHRDGTATSFMSANATNIGRVITVVLFGIISLRLAAVSIEVLMRPIFAWDAWDAWVPRTLQFFSSGTLEAPISTIKPSHGLFTNLVHLWQMLALGTHQSTMTGLPWLLAFIGLVLGLYGAVLQMTHSVAVATLGAWLLISIPFMSIHSMLVGYADIWVTLSFFLGMSCCHLLLQRKTPEVALLACGYAVLCMFTKQAGLGIGVILLVGVLWSLTASRPILQAMMLSSGAAACTLLVLFILKEEINEIQIPNIGTLKIGDDRLTLNGWFQISIDQYTPIGRPIAESIFWFSNWHLLFFIVFTAIFASIFDRTIRSALSSPVPLSLALGIAYTWMYHGFQAPDSAFGHQGLSRSLLYFAPAIILWLLFCMKIKFDYSHASSDSAQQ